MLSIVVISIVGFFIYASSRASSLEFKVPFYEDLMPGSPVPDGVGCYPDSTGMINEGYCTVWRNRTINLSVSTDTKRIDYASYLDLEDRLGDFLLLWGRPAGWTCDGPGYYFFWADRSIYVVPRYGLSVFTVVGVVRFGTPTTDYRPMPEYSLLPHGCPPYR